MSCRLPLRLFNHNQTNSYGEWEVAKRHLSLPMATKEKVCPP